MVLHGVTVPFTIIVTTAMLQENSILEILAITRI